MRQTSFLQSQTILRALEFTSAKGGFGSNTKQKKAAIALIRNMKSNTSLSGRHRQLRDLLKTGATVAEMIRATRSSRRTIFRYLNHFEDAGLEIVIQKGKYRLA